MWTLSRWRAVALVIGLGLAGCAEEVPQAPEAVPPGSPPTASVPADPMTRAQQSLVLVQVAEAAAVGMVVDSGGDVLVFHPLLAEDPDQPVTLTLAESDRTEGVARGGDPRTGLAVVTVDPAAGLVPAVLGDSDAVEVGDEVTLLTLGPEGDVWTVTGEVTATDEVVPGTGTAMIRFSVEHDRTGGGPVVNSAGEVIGLYSASSTGAGGEAEAHFAIPSSVASRVADQLIETGQVIPPYLGVSVEDAPGGGALVQQVAAGSPAEQAGLRAGDVIVQVGDRAVEIAADVVVEVQGRQVGEELAVAYLRDGAETQTTATLTAAPAE